MPWQRHVVDVALEVDPATGRLVHREVRLTVPRQSGKTTLILAMIVHRALAARGYGGGRQRMIYTAQDRNSAREKVLDDFVPVLDDARAMRGRYTVRKANGSEGIRFAGGSRLGLIAGTKRSGHGPTLDLGLLDEAFAQRDDRIEQAMKPTMITRPSPQYWVVSTAGDDDSTYLNRKIESGRALIVAGEPSSVAYFDWSAADSLDGIDPADPAVWRRCMPALGHTVSEAVIRAEYETMRDGEEGIAGFARAYLNIKNVGAVVTVIPLPWWRDCADPDGQIDGHVVLAADIAPDRSWGAIALAGRRADELPQVEIVASREGTDWMLAELVELSRRNGDAPVVIDEASPAVTLMHGLRTAEVDVTVTSAKDMAAACGLLYDANRNRAWRHLGDPILEQALKAAATRPLGDGAWGWRRRDGGAEICTLVAATEAHWGLLTLPEPIVVGAMNL